MILSSQRQDDTNRGWFNHRVESFGEINPSFLMKPLGDEASFIPRDGAISIALDLVNPTAPNEVLVIGRRNERPRVLPLKGVELRSHGRTLFRDL